MKTIGRLLLACWMLVLANRGLGQPEEHEMRPVLPQAALPFDAQGRPNRDRSGPWNNDVLVHRAARDGTVTKLATFPRAGVPTVARAHDGRLIAAHQHFPENDDANFDKVAVHFSSDEGRTWTAAEVIQVAGLPEGMRFPFDPTLVPLPDSRIRLYFTSLEGRRFERDRPQIYSAVSDDGIHYTCEPGVRFGVEGRPVIDCAVVLHQGVFHLLAPDNGAGGPPAGPGDDRRPMDQRPRPGIGYHAVSKDGLIFTRVGDVRMEGSRRWLGAAVSEGALMAFFGTGGPGAPGRPGGGIWAATSQDGSQWRLNDRLPLVPGADPGAVRLKDGSWLVVSTGPPRPGTPSDRMRPRVDQGPHPFGKPSIPGRR